MNIANKLTISRVLLVPFFIWFLFSEFYNKFFWCLILFLIAGITDKLDGVIARKCSQVTSFGEFADPLADKILNLSAFLCFVELGIISSIPVILILSRELIITSTRMMAIKQNKILSVNYLGKFKTLTQMSFIMLILLLKHINKANTYILNAIAWYVAFITLISGVVYMAKNRKILSFC
ncbi:MAG: CDP-diacylglycerol--glycerol-3-phosphate 3-phosphatidyltransferase [Oscillospiraceae bacterium]|jgi:CDP-diacylglycerol--glycerol-3-phosphate 3-phosphatidyltransferase|nr:CDP-diacylglycerol--glycerol-3-phosphate 3-phosphatidyltransferase [Oscillospiraceae bacterium]